MSTVLMKKSEKFYDDICALSWHLLSVQDQKAIKLVMNHAKYPMQLTTGIKVLNMETFVEVSEKFENSLL
jgi:hypothetical protein